MIKKFVLLKSNTIVIKSYAKKSPNNLLLQLRSQLLQKMERIEASKKFAHMF